MAGSPDFLINLNLPSIPGLPKIPEPSVRQRWKASESIVAGSLVTLSPAGVAMAKPKDRVIGVAIGSAKPGQVVDVELGLSQQMIPEAVEVPSERERVHAHPCVERANLAKASKIEIAAMALIVSAMRCHDLEHIKFSNGSHLVRVRTRRGSVEEKLDGIDTVRALEFMARTVRARLLGAEAVEEGDSQIELAREWQRAFVERRVSRSVGPFIGLDAAGRSLAAEQLSELDDFVFWFLELAKMDVAIDIARMGESLAEILKR